ncbi:MAG: threonine--tRNA ligase, partial [Euryarchaeota archaeon]|nr:threonine--tRNA ligase [Euryarchaeota archaeon]
MLTVDVGLDVPHEYATGISVGEIIKHVHGKKSGAVAATIDGNQVDLSYEINSNCSIRPILASSEEGLYILRHSCAHLLAQAVLEFFPDAKPTIGPPIENGFYYDFQMPAPSEEYLRAIEKRMKAIVKENLTVQ